MTNKTHYRKAFNSPYLSSADIVEPTVLTIARVDLKSDATKKTKDLFNTAHFVEKELRAGEKLKPMILNAYNSKMLHNLTSSHFIEDWVNIHVTIYVDSNVRFGRDTVEGLRISPEAPVLKKPELTQDSPRFGSAVDAYVRDGNFEKIEQRAFLSNQTKQLIVEQANKAKVENDDAV